MEDLIIKNGVLIKCTGVQKKYVIPEGVNEIGSFAFSGNLSLECIEFSSTVNEISESAFEGCANLVEIRNYGSVQYYGKACFKGAGLEEIYLERNVLAIGEEAFSFMPNLKTVYLSVDNNVGLKGVFIRNNKLEKVNYSVNYFYPSFMPDKMTRKKSDSRPTFQDVFKGSLFFKTKYLEYRNQFKRKICPECGGKIKHKLFSARCSKCGISLINLKAVVVYW